MTKRETESVDDRRRRLGSKGQQKWGNICSSGRSNNLVSTETTMIILLSHVYLAR